jgi:hypothetical protein
LTGPKLRAVCPYLFVTFFLLALASITGLSTVEHAVAAGAEHWLMSFLLAIKLNPIVLMMLFFLLPWLPAFFLARWLAKYLAKAYQHKAFSETLYLLGSLWFVALFIESGSLSYSRLGFSAYVLLLAGLVIPPLMHLMAPFLRPVH